MTITTTLNAAQIEGVNFVVQRTNQEREARHNAEQLQKPEAERVPYVPISAEDYLAQRFGEVIGSYRKQYEESRANDADNLALYQAVIAADPVVREQIKAQVALALAQQNQ